MTASNTTKFHTYTIHLRFPLSTSGMHDFRDNEVLLQAGYDVIVITPPGGALR